MAAMSTVLAVASLAATGYSAYSQQQTAKKGIASQERMAQEAIQAQANQKPDAKPQASKTPDRPAMSAANAAMGAKGNSGTFLTGPSGVDPSTLNLGKNTLLGE